MIVVMEKLVLGYDGTIHQTRREWNLSTIERTTRSRTIGKSALEIWATIFCGCNVRSVQNGVPVFESDIDSTRVYLEAGAV